MNTKENCRDMLWECRKQETMVVLGSDSHVDADIANCQYAAQVLEEVNFPEELIANTSLEKLKSCLKHRKKV